MNADERKRATSDLAKVTHVIIGAAQTVSRELGVSFLKKVYENALAHELVKANVFVQKQAPISVTYDGKIVGDYTADLLV